LVLTDLPSLFLIPFKGHIIELTSKPFNLKAYLNFLHLNIFISKDLMLPMSTLE